MDQNPYQPPQAARLGAASETGLQWPQAWRVVVGGLFLLAGIGAVWIPDWEWRTSATRGHVFAIGINTSWALVSIGFIILVTRGSSRIATAGIAVILLIYFYFAWLALFRP